MLTENLPDRIDIPHRAGIYPSHTRMMYAALIRREGIDIARQAADFRSAAILRYISAAEQGGDLRGKLRRVRIFLCCDDIAAMIDEVAAAARCGIPATFVLPRDLPVPAAGAVRLDGQILLTNSDEVDDRFRIIGDDVYIDCRKSSPDDIFSGA